MNPLVILLFIVFGITMIYLINQYTPVVESFNNKNKSRDLSNFINFNLTDKPVANYAPYPIYTWWKYGHDCHKYDDCDQYRCQNKQFNAFNAQPCFNLVKGKYVDPIKNKKCFSAKNPQQQCAYFEDSEKYCMLNPRDPRCPNHWIK